MRTRPLSVPMKREPWRSAFAPPAEESPSRSGGSAAKHDTAPHSGRMRTILTARTLTRCCANAATRIACAASRWMARSRVSLPRALPLALAGPPRESGPPSPSSLGTPPPNRLAMYDVALPTALCPPPAAATAPTLCGRCPSYHVGHGTSICARSVAVSAKNVKQTSSATITETSFSQTSPTTTSLRRAVAPRRVLADAASGAEPRHIASFTNDHTSTRSEVTTHRSEPLGFDATRRTRDEPSATLVTRGSPYGNQAAVRAAIGYASSS